MLNGESGREKGRGGREGDGMGGVNPKRLTDEDTVPVSLSHLARMAYSLAGSWQKPRFYQFQCRFRHLPMPIRHYAVYPFVP